MFEKQIKFIAYNSDMVDIWPHPKPASRFIPEGYKKLERFPLNGNMNYASVKTCIPFMDSMFAGYIIPFDQDYLIDTVGQIEQPMPEGDWRLIPSQGEPDEYHDKGQLPPEWHSKVPMKAGKFRNVWIIKTPPGYSCLFCKPMNRLEDRIDIIPGIVDTDTYGSIINFPFILNMGTFDKQFVLKKGDPMVQVIPFKRESWKASVGFEQFKDHKNTENKLKSLWSDKYKKLFWKKKSYR